MLLLLLLVLVLERSPRLLLRPNADVSAAAAADVRRLGRVIRVTAPAEAVPADVAEVKGEDLPWVWLLLLLPLPLPVPTVLARPLALV